MTRRAIDLSTTPAWRLEQAVNAARAAYDRPPAELARAAREIARLGSVRERAAAALAYAQRVGYVSDPVSAQGEPLEQFQSVEDTLRDGGDCEDLSALLLALCALAGLESAPIWIDYEREGARQNHVSVQVLVNGVWLWADPSVAGAVLGEEPREAARRTGDWSAVR